MAESAQSIFVIFGRVRFLTEPLSWACCCLASGLRCQLWNCCRGTKSRFILVLDMLGWGKEATLRELCWTQPRINHLLGGKFLPPTPQFSGLLSQRCQNLLGCIVLEVEISWWTVCPWAFEVQVAPTSFPRSSPLWQNIFCTQLRLSPGHEQEKATLNSFFLDIWLL